MSGEVTQSSVGVGRLILLCGLPGAGKTTLARRLAGEIPAVRLCPDEWLAHLGLDLYDEPAQDLLRLGQTVILEYGFWSRAEREAMRLGARALGAAVELRYLAVPLEELHRRLERRNAAGDAGTAPISRDMLDHWATIFEPPTPDELARYDA
jgi:predicted kinase